MGDLRGFAKSIRIRGAAVERNTNEVVRRVALLIDTAVVMSTPVLTGRARANWRVSVGAPNGEVLPTPASPGEGVHRALEEAASAVAGYAGGAPIHITNNLPYINALNGGSSTQAPAGFIEIAVARGVAAVQSAQNLTGDELEIEVS